MSVAPLATAMSVFISVKTASSSTPTIVLFQAVVMWLLRSSKVISRHAKYSISLLSRPPPLWPALPESAPCLPSETELWWRHWGPLDPTVSEKRFYFCYSLRFRWQQPWKNPFSHLDHCQGLFPSCRTNSRCHIRQQRLFRFSEYFLHHHPLYIRIPFSRDFVHIVNLKPIVQVKVHFFVTQGFWFYQCPFHDRLIGFYQCFQRGKSHWRTVVENRLCHVFPTVLNPGVF